MSMELTYAEEKVIKFLPSLFRLLPKKDKSGFENERSN